MLPPLNELVSGTIKQWSFYSIISICFECVYSTFKNSFGPNYFCHLISEYINVEFIYQGSYVRWGVNLCTIIFYMSTSKTVKGSQS